MHGGSFINLMKRWANDCFAISSQAYVAQAQVGQNLKRVSTQVQFKYDFVLER